LDALAHACCERAGTAWACTDSAARIGFGGAGRQGCARIGACIGADADYRTRVATA
jgi:hypothetical protein